MNVETILTAIFTICTSAMLIMIPLNFHLKDRLQADLLKACMAQQAPTYIDCIDHVNGHYTGTRWTGDGTKKGY